MRRLTYYVNVSLDGRIAGPGHEIDAFPVTDGLMGFIREEYPETLPVHVRQHLGIADVPNRRFDTVVMGRETYAQGLDAGITSPYPHLRQVVLSRTLTSPDPAVEVTADDAVQVVRELKSQAGEDIWLAGGGTLAGALVGEIDEMVVKRSPVVLGAGVPVFAGTYSPVAFSPVATRDLGSGLSVTTYRRA